MHYCKRSKLLGENNYTHKKWINDHLRACPSNLYAGKVRWKYFVPTTTLAQLYVMPFIGNLHSKMVIIFFDRSNSKPPLGLKKKN